MRLAPGRVSPLYRREPGYLPGNTEGLYSGIESFDERLQIADSTARVTRKGSERILRFCFDYDKKHGFKKVKLVHKANILKLSLGMFLMFISEHAHEFHVFTINDLLIDILIILLV